MRTQFGLIDSEHNGSTVRRRDLFFDDAQGRELGYNFVTGAKRNAGDKRNVLHHAIVTRDAAK